MFVPGVALETCSRGHVQDTQVIAIAAYGSFQRHAWLKGGGEESRWGRLRMEAIRQRRAHRLSPSGLDDHPETRTSPMPAKRPFLMCALESSALRSPEPHYLGDEKTDES